MIKLSDYVMNYIASIGVKDVFFLAGGGCMHLVDSLGKNPQLNQIANLHEQCAAIGAGGYSQYTGNIGVVLVTTGPGGTNAITGVAAAWIDSTPMLVISGQVKRADLMIGKNVRQMGPQEVDIISMVKPITKYAVTVMDPLRIKEHLERAIYYAKEGRKGPVWLDIPLDIQGAIIDQTKLKGFEQKEQKKESISFSSKVFELINNAQRPVILVGNGVRLADAIELFLELIEKLNIPVLTTWKSIDIIEEEHPFYFGRPGAVGQRGANFIQQNSDLLITVGARLDLGQIAFNYKNLAREAKKIVVDIDEAEIEKIDTHIDLPLNISAKDFIIELLNNIELMKDVDRNDWINTCRKWKQKYPVVLDEYRDSKNVNTYILIEQISELLSSEDIVVPGSSGTCSEITSQSFKIKKGQRFINSPGLGSMGFGVAESIGVCIASGYKKTICIIGDGGLQHNIQELQLLKRYHLPIKVFVLNNNAYASIRLMQERIFDGNLVGCDDSNDVTLPDTLDIANAYGLANKRIISHKNLRKDLEEVLDGNNPIICDVIINLDLQTTPRTSSIVKPNGQIVSKPLEDLWPFLDKDEFRENMIVKILEE